MDFVADILLGAAALGAAFYCWVLSQRLRALTGLESGIGGAVALLSVQVDELSRALERTGAAARSQGEGLQETLRRAEDTARRLELMMAALQELPPATAESEPFYRRAGAAR